MYSASQLPEKDQELQGAEREYQRVHALPRVCFRFINVKEVNALEMRTKYVNTERATYLVNKAILDGYVFLDYACIFGALHDLVPQNHLQLWSLTSVS